MSACEQELDIETIPPETRSPLVRKTQTIDRSDQLAVKSRLPLLALDGRPGLAGDGPWADLRALVRGSREPVIDAFFLT